jgi:hypothetical protein
MVMGDGASYFEEYNFLARVFRPFVERSCLHPRDACSLRAMHDGDR